MEPEEGVPLAAEELARLAPECDGIVCHLTDRMDASVLQPGRAGRLRVVANAAVGYDNIDVVTATSLGVTVCNTPGVLDDTTADLAFLLILAATRLASDAERDLREGRWKGWGFGTHLARDVHGATLGLVGYGRIAQAVARRADGFGMEVLHTARHDTGHKGFVPALHDLLRRSDIVSLHVPLNESTRHLIGSAELAAMKPTGGPHQHGPGPGGRRGRTGRCAGFGVHLQLPAWTSSTASRRSTPGCSAPRGRHCSPTSEAPPSRPGRAWPGSPVREFATCWPGGSRATSCFRHPRRPDGNRSFPDSSYAR